MAHHVEHLHAAEAVDDVIVREAETERLVVVRFGHSVHADCLSVDAAMAAAAELVGSIAALYAVDIEEVQDFNAMYELHDRPCTVMFFHGNRHVDVRGTGGSRDDIAWAAYCADEFAGLVWTVHERATAGRRLVDLDYELPAVV